MPHIETTSGVRIHYEERGGGIPLVLVHGWSTSAVVWRFQGELARCSRVISVDLRGHGESSAPPTGYTIADLADDLADLFAALDLTGAVLLGWSLGAQVVLTSCRALRDRLAGLVLVGGTPRFTAAGDWPYGLPAREPRGMELALRRDYQRTMGGFFRSMFAPGELSREQENRVAREVVMPGRLPPAAVASATLSILASADLRDVLPAVDRPVLLLHGSEDTICPAGASRYMAEHLADARLVLLEGMGHAPFLSHPDDFNRILRAFLEELHGRH